MHLYDRQADSFCWGSWILTHGAPSAFSIESALIVYHYARSLGFTKAHFDVRKDNTSVWKFHKRFGAKIVRETPQDYFFTISAEAITKALARYAKFLPSGITISRSR